MKLIRIIKSKLSTKKMPYHEAADYVMERIYQNLKKEGYYDWLREEWHEYRFVNNKEKVILRVWFDLGDYYNGLANKVTFILFVYAGNGNYKRLERPYVTTIEKAMHITNIADKIKIINFYDKDDYTTTTQKIIESLYNKGKITVLYNNKNINFTPIIDDEDLRENEMYYVPDIDIDNGDKFWVDFTLKKRKGELRVESGFFYEPRFDKNYDIDKVKNNVDIIFNDLQKFFNEEVPNKFKRLENNN